MSGAIWEFDMYTTEQLEEIDSLITKAEEIMPEFPINSEFKYALQWEINERELNKGKENV